MKKRIKVTTHKEIDLSSAKLYEPMFDGARAFRKSVFGVTSFNSPVYLADSKDHLIYVSLDEVGYVLMWTSTDCFYEFPMQAFSEDELADMRVSITDEMLKPRQKKVLEYMMQNLVVKEAMKYFIDGAKACDIGLDAFIKDMDFLISYRKAPAEFDYMSEQIGKEQEEYEKEEAKRWLRHIRESSNKKRLKLLRKMSMAEFLGLREEMTEEEAREWLPLVDKE